MPAKTLTPGRKKAQMRLCVGTDKAKCNHPESFHPYREDGVRRGGCTVQGCLCKSWKPPKPA